MEKMATRNAYGDTLAELGASRPELVVLDADLSGSTKTATFAQAFPERFFNMGIAEQNLMGTAAGLAASGKLVFASTFAVFATGRAYDQIRNSICYPNLNVKIAATHAGLTVGEDGGSHQMIEDISLMRSLPNMTVLVPADGYQAKACLLAASEWDGPCYIRLGRPKIGLITPKNQEFRIGRGQVMREGVDVTIVACGIMVEKALNAAESLAEEGYSAAVINMASLKPLDEELIIKWARTTGAIVTAEEHNRYGGLRSAVAEVLAKQVPIPMEYVAVEDIFGESGTPDALLEKFGLTVQRIEQAAKEAIARK